MTAICIPIVSSNDDELILDIKEIQSLPYDWIEWRIDCVEDMDCIFSMAQIIRQSFSCPLIATIRTQEQGGKWAQGKDEYISLYQQLVLKKLVDCIDLESHIATAELVEWFHVQGVSIIFSDHRFDRGVNKKDIDALYERCLHVHADVLKIASMPETSKEMVDQLLAMYDISLQNQVKVICIGMSKAGKISRVIGGLFGSILTFASANKKSAPNQIGARELKRYLQCIDEA